MKNNLVNGAWLAECTLDLSQLGYPEQKQWDVNIQRFNQAKKSLSAWMPLTNGDHTSPENFIRLNLSGKPGKIQMPPSPAEINEQTGVPFEAAGLKEVSYVSELFSGDRIRARLRGKGTAPAFNVPVPRGKGENVLLFHGSRPWVAGNTAAFLSESGCRVTTLDSKYLDGLGGASIKTFLTDLVEPEPIGPDAPPHALERLVGVHLPIRLPCVQFHVRIECLLENPSVLFILPGPLFQSPLLLLGQLPGEVPWQHPFRTFVRSLT